MQPFLEKQIKDLQDSDTKISVTGLVVEKGDKHFTLDDGTGTIIVRAEDLSHVTDFVKAFGQINNVEGNKEIFAYVIKDMSEIDKELFKKLKSEYSV
jgi:hypothetical protein